MGVVDVVFSERKSDFSVFLHILVAIKPGFDLCLKVVAEGVVGVLDKLSFALDLCHVEGSCGAPLSDLVDALVEV